ncbi:hypothetical protein PWG15_30585 (plasmid) [Ensifer adhaerens]|uniref:hypothetical protein n=1 Tax=Ensifer adhaerens TaxID=106592 RepID=UPI0023A94D74|nr:hypothetical protein [Ensifer adhaerens]WDZ79779.1 hypothetical protein PWG15_30585 [Ensifer adhaerens]
MRRVLASLWRAALLMCLTTPGLSIEQPAMASEQQMRFVVVRSNQSACEPTCPEWISAEGVIGAKTPALLKATLKTLGGRNLPLVLASPGGDTAAAMAVGRLIRKNKLSVAVGTTIFIGCQRDQENCTANDGKGADFIGAAISQGACTEACALVLASGVRRLAGGETTVANIPTVTGNGTGSKKLAAYYDEMGVRYQKLAEGQRDVDGNPGPWQLFKALLVTNTLAVDQLVDAQICKGTPAPDNCRVFTTMDLE